LVAPSDRRALPDLGAAGAAGAAGSPGLLRGTNSATKIVRIGAFGNVFKGDIGGRRRGRRGRAGWGRITVRDRNGDVRPLEQEAHRFVARLVSGEARTGDAEAIRQWRRRSPSHEAAFAEAVKQWRDFGLVGDRLRRRVDLPDWTPPLVSRRAVLGGVGLLAAGT